MKRGDTITIREISNGVEVCPDISPNVAVSTKEILAFTNAESFVGWIKQHFSVYEQPSWDGDNH